MIISVYRSYCYSCQILVNLEFSRQVHNKMRSYSLHGKTILYNLRLMPDVMPV
jgi:hypothetical protein